MKTDFDSALETPLNENSVFLKKSYKKQIKIIIFRHG